MFSGRASALAYGTVSGSMSSDSTECQHLDCLAILLRFYGKVTNIGMSLLSGELGIRNIV